MKISDKHEQVNGVLLIRPIYGKSCGFFFSGKSEKVYSLRRLNLIKDLSLLLI